MYFHVCFIRLEGVEVRLQETSEAFEQSRTVAKKSKAEYELVKKMRYIYHLVLVQPDTCDDVDENFCCIQI